MRFFIDNNLPPAISEALNALSQYDDSEVVHLRAKFAANTPDVEWIKALGAEGDWVIVTSDRAMKKNAHERQALIDSGLTVLFLGKSWSHLKFWDMAHKLVKCWPSIISTCETVVTGSAFEVKLGGKLGPIPLQ